jgi:hypothetical protein
MAIRVRIPLVLVSAYGMHIGVHPSGSMTWRFCGGRQAPSRPPSVIPEAAASGCPGSMNTAFCRLSPAVFMDSGLARSATRNDCPNEGDRLRK